MNRKRIKKVIAAFISVVVTLVLVSFVKPESVLVYIQETNLQLLGYYLLASFCGAVFRAWRWHLMLEKELRFSDILSITLVRNATVDMLPARLGEATYVFLLKLLNIPITKGISSLGAGVVLDVTVLFVLVSFFVEFKFGLLCLLVSVILLILLLFSPDILGKVKFLAGLGSALEFVKNRKLFLGLLAVTVVLRVSKYGSLYLLALAVVQTQLPVAQTVLAFVGAEAAASMPASGVLGFGAYESIWVAVSKLGQIELEDVLNKVVTIHLITQVWGIMLAVAGLGWIFINERRKKTGQNFGGCSRGSVDN